MHSDVMTPNPTTITGEKINWLKIKSLRYEKHNEYGVTFKYDHTNQFSVSLNNLGLQLELMIIFLYSRCEQKNG